MKLCNAIYIKPLPQCQLKKSLLNKKVLRVHQKDLEEGAVPRSTGKEFHRQGATTEKAAQFEGWLKWMDLDYLEEGNPQIS